MSPLVPLEIEERLRKDPERVELSEEFLRTRPVLTC
jgi:hypothetical protein